MMGSLPADVLFVSPQANFFDEYQMEGFSSEDNEICLEVTPDNLSRALKNTQNAKAVKVKLTKKHCPCLTITAELVSLGTSKTRSSSALPNVPHQKRHNCENVCVELMLKRNHDSGGSEHFYPSNTDRMKTQKPDEVLQQLRLTNLSG